MWIRACYLVAFFIHVPCATAQVDTPCSIDLNVLRERASLHADTLYLVTWVRPGLCGRCDVEHERAISEIRRRISGAQLGPLPVLYVTEVRRMIEFEAVKKHFPGLRLVASVNGDLSCGAVLRGSTPRVMIICCDRQFQVDVEPTSTEWQLDDCSCLKTDRSSN